MNPLLTKVRRNIVPIAGLMLLGGLVGYGAHRTAPTQAPGLSIVKPGLADRQAEDVPPQAEPIVYVTATGHRYHRAGCESLRRSSIPISLADAEARGYTPCKICFPQ